MEKVHVELTQAVQTLLQAAVDGGALGVSLTVDRANVVAEPLEAANEPKIVVYPGERTAGESGRGGSERTYRVYVAIMEQIDTHGDAAARLAREDLLIGLAELVEQTLEHTAFELDSGLQLQWLQADSLGAPTQPYFAPALYTLNQFTAVVSATYMTVF